MKKIVLIIAVVGIFLAYSVVLRHQRSAAVSAPPSSSNPSKSGSSVAVNSSAGSSTNSSVSYKNGNYVGDVENAFYGNVQVSATISGGKIIEVNFLEYPNDNPNSQYVNQQAIPYLKQEAIKAQSANVSIISGATFTSQAFMKSLAAALSKAA